MSMDPRTPGSELRPVAEMPWRLTAPVRPSVGSPWQRQQLRRPQRPWLALLRSQPSPLDVVRATRACAVPHNEAHRGPTRPRPAQYICLPPAVVPRSEAGPPFRCGSLSPGPAATRHVPRRAATAHRSPPARVTIAPILPESFASRWIFSRFVNRRLDGSVWKRAAGNYAGRRPSLSRHVVSDTSMSVAATEPSS